MIRTKLDDIIPPDELRAVNEPRSSWTMRPRSSISLEVPPRKALITWPGTTPATPHYVHYQMWIADRMNYAVSLLSSSVELDSDIRSGVPVFRGTRVPVSQVLAEIAEGSTVDEVADDLDIDANAIRGFIECISVVIDRPLT